MSRVVRLRMSGQAPETDAPSVEDALDQVRDCVAVLHGVEEALAGDGASAIVWRIVGASRNSALAFQLEAFPASCGVSIDRRAQATVTDVALGLDVLQTTARRPSHFSDKVLTRAQDMFDRVSNGLSLFEADFGDDLPRTTLTPGVARAAATHTRRLLTPSGEAHEELGSIEGTFRGVETDGYRRRIAIVKSRVNGDLVKCIVSETALPAIETHEIGEVWGNRRVQVFGRLHFNANGALGHIDASRIRFLRSRSDLPQSEDIVDQDFTGGLRSEEYLEKLRDGSLP